VQCLVVWLHFWQLGKLRKALLIKVKVPRLWWCQTARRSWSTNSDEHVVCDNILAVPDHKLLPILRCQVTILGTIRWTSKFRFSDCFYGSDRRQNIPVSTSVHAVHVVCITDWFSVLFYLPIYHVFDVKFLLQTVHNTTMKTEYMNQSVIISPKNLNMYLSAP